MESQQKVIGLAHIKTDQLDASIFDTTGQTFQWGPLKVEFSVDLTIPQVTFTVYLAGINIGGGTINPQNPSVTVGGGALGSKAEITLSLDPAQKQVTYDAQVCAPIVGCKTATGVLFSWS